MLNTKVDEILFTDGKVTGIRSGSDTAKAPLVICDPSYVAGLGKVKEQGKVVRAICIMNHPIPNTNDATSCQVIIPQKQLGRRYGNYYTILTLFRYLHFNGQQCSRRLRKGSVHCNDLNNR
jgi:Rab GDP dissociation inhibitor